MTPTEICSSVLAGLREQGNLHPGLAGQVFTGTENSRLLSRLQQTLREKQVELQALTVQEKRLTRGEVFCVLRPRRFLSHICSPRPLTTTPPPPRPSSPHLLR